MEQNDKKELEKDLQEAEAAKADAEAVKKELEKALQEAEAAKAEAEAAKKELEVAKAENEKLKAKPSKKGNAKATEEELVPVYIIKTKEKKDDVFCAINGRTYQIKRGEQVMVPKAVQEVLKHQTQMDQLAMENMEKASKNFAE